MKIRHLLTVGILSGVLLASTAFAQNINTDTTSTTVGSTQFGTVLTPLDLQTVMQSTVALTCTGPVDARVCAPTAGQGTSTAFVRVDALPGSFTDSPTGTVSAQPNFACGSTASAATNLSGNCTLNMEMTGGVSTVSQTAPAFSGTRQLVGNIDTNIVVGDGGATAGMPDGFMAFTMDPATGAATIDQFITHTIDLGGGSLMVFNQRDATIGAGNLIPDPIGDPLTLVAFTAASQQAAVMPANLGLVSRTTLAQGAADGFGGLNLDVQTEWTGAGGTFPAAGSFVTPGLNTGLTSATFPNFPGFAFP